MLNSGETSVLHRVCLEDLLPYVSDGSSILGSENCQSSSSLKRLYI
ncbi:MAG: hypothetical protein OJF51_003646 [Nitrospira sp.]|nr:MAG: hypothetical protein OJF51_003646 [Nitrospira sp.]